MGGPLEMRFCISTRPPLLCAEDSLKRMRHDLGRAGSSFLQLLHHLCWSALALESFLQWTLIASFLACRSRLPFRAQRACGACDSPLASESSNEVCGAHSASKRMPSWTQHDSSHQSMYVITSGGTAMKTIPNTPIKTFSGVSNGMRKTRKPAHAITDEPSATATVRACAL